MTPFVATMLMAGGAAPAGFAFDPAKKSGDITLSGANNNVATRTAFTVGTYNTALGLTPMAVGDVVYFTCTGTFGSNAPGVGLGNASTSFVDELGNTGASIGGYVNGNIELSGGIVGNMGFGIANGDIIGVKLSSATQVQFNSNGGAFSAAFTHNITGAIYAGVTIAAVGGVETGN